MYCQCTNSIYQQTVSFLIGREQVSVCLFESVSMVAKPLTIPHNEPIQFKLIHKNLPIFGSLSEYKLIQFLLSLVC